MAATGVSQAVLSCFKSQKFSADLSLLVTVKGHLADYATNQEFLASDLQAGDFVLDMFDSIRSELSDVLEDCLNYNRVRWLCAPCPGKSGYLMNWRIRVLEIEGSRAFLIQGHDCERRPINSLDPLTGLPLRDSFYESVQNNKTSKGSVVYFDIKDFKAINQSHGSACGNELLKIITHELKAVFVDASIISRVGDDQFCVLTPNTTPDADIEKFLTFFDHPVYALGQLIKIEMHIGTCAYPHVVASLGEAVEGAFFALQAYKGSEDRQMSKNWSFSKTDYLQKQRKQRLKELMGPAILKGEFYLLYQPIVDVNKNLIALEALMRWKSATEGFVSPGEFIQIAEESSQHMLTLGSWALRYACIEMAKLGPEFNHVKVSVNVSPVQFRKPDFIQEVRQILLLTGLPAHRLQLEITEGILVSNPKASELMLKLIKELGVSIAVDDFGIGYSSLSYLKSFSIDTLKVDKSFVDDITKSSKDAAICASIIDIAQRLKVKCTAEGIESVDQFEALKKLGCTTFQGYLFGKPQLLSDLTKK